MKRFVILCLAISFATTCWAQNQQGGGQGSRTFQFTASDLMSTEFPQHAIPILQSKTNVTTASYLYISGHLDVNWVVNGSGVGGSSDRSTLMFYHTDSVTLVFSGFDNPQKRVGGSLGAQAIETICDVSLSNSETRLKLFDTGPVPIARLNEIFTSSGPIFNPTVTSGALQLDFYRQIMVGDDVGPGSYENAGNITVIRN